MKKALLIITLNLVSIFSSLAQFDDKFYFPSKDWKPLENLDFTEKNFLIDKDTITAVLFKSAVKTKATIIFYHGTGGNISYNSSFAQLLTADGFQVFMIDFRGYGKSSGKPTHVNIANDAQFIFDEIIDLDEFKNLPIIIYGASIGSQIATKIAKDNKNKVSALILDGAMSSFTDMALMSAPESQKEMIANFVTSPYSAIEDIKDLESTPKLIIHGLNDKSVPFAQGKAVFTNAKEPKTFWEYDGDHLDSAAKYPAEYLRKINRLLNGI